MARLFTVFVLWVGIFYGVDASALGNTVYDFTVKDIKGDNVEMKRFKGNVLLIVNTASQCGFTSQYKGLQEIYSKYRAQGLEILGFPSNDFGGQEPGSNRDIKEFCELKYKVSFPMFAKLTVLGSSKAPLFKYLTEDAGREFKREIDWNFEKFLVNRKGQLVARYKSMTEPTSKELTSRVEDLLKEK